MICKHCNTEISDEVTVCPECGADPKTGEIKEQEFFDSEDDFESLPPKKEEDKTSVINMDDRRKFQLEEIEERRNRKKQRQKRNRIISICVLVVLVAAAVGSGIYLINAGFSNDDPVIVSTPQPTADAQLVTPDDCGDTSCGDVYETPLPTVQVSSTAAPAIDNSVAVSDKTSSVTAKPSGSSSSATAKPSGSSSTSSSSTGKTNTTTSSSSTGKTNTSTSSSSTGKTNTTTSSSSTGKTNTSTTTSSTGTKSSVIHGKDVIYDGNTSSWLFRFTIDGDEYIAKVAAGSSTADVENKYFTASIRPTAQKFEGKTVYEVVHMTDCENGDFIIADSASKLLTKEDIADIPQDKLKYARNEIFARHGRKFTKQVYSDYFTKLSWYKINPDYNYDNEAENLSEVERKNVILLKEAEEN